MQTLPFPIFEVGGCVRDELLGVESKDIDFACEAGSFERMHFALTFAGFEIFLSQPEHFTIRARFPKGDPRNPLTADFVLCRKDGAYSDGRRPDTVEPGTLLDDLARRDFTVNAMAKAEDGTLIDPHDGQGCLRAGVLRCVGRAEDRLREDALRALRAIRFMVTKHLSPDEELANALHAEWLPPLLGSVSKERQREELTKCFRRDTLLTLELLAAHKGIQEVVFADGLWLEPTLKGAK